MTSIIIPAHNEQAVIHRTLTSLVAGLDLTDMEILVVCNGCTDRTAMVARAIEGPIKVLEIPQASKTGALNAGDKNVRTYPRVYLDADVEIDGTSMSRVIDELEQPGALAAESGARIDTSQSSLLVRSYYMVAMALHSQRPGDIGCGLYAMSRQGRSRFTQFPNIIADDAYARAHFGTDELIRVPGAISVVRAPVRINSLIQIKTRSRLGTTELQTKYPDLWKAKRSHTQSLAGKARSLPIRVWPAIPVYVVVQLVTRWRAKNLGTKRGTHVWQRDESSRGLQR